MTRRIFWDIIAVYWEMVRTNASHLIFDHKLTMNKGENKMKKIKNIICILAALALISPEYASGATLIETEGSGFMIGGAMFTTAFISRFIHFGLLSDDLYEQRNNSKGANSLMREGGRRITRTFNHISIAALILTIPSAVLGEETNYNIVKAHFHNLDKDEFKKDILKFKGKEDRELQLKGKDLVESYNYINETCGYAKSTRNISRSNTNSEEQRKVIRTVKTYKEKGCYIEYYKLVDAYAVDSLLHDGVITERDANSAKNYFATSGKNPVYIPVNNGK